MNLSWTDISKLIVLIGGSGTLVTLLLGLIVWVFKQRVQSFFSKKLKDHETTLLEKLQENEAKLQIENKKLELSLNDEIRKSELDISKKINFEQKHYDLLMQSYQKVWQQLLVFQYFIVQELPSMLNKGELIVDNTIAEPVREKIWDIQKTFIFLPDNINEKLEALVDLVEADLNVLLTELMKTKKQTPVDPGGRQEVKGDALIPISKALKKLQDNLRFEIKTIKGDIQKDYSKRFSSKN